MDATIDELAGVVELFGGLTRTELNQALNEVAYRTNGQSLDEEKFNIVIQDSVEAFGLIRIEQDGNPLFVAGPTAFPTVPKHAEDLPHILQIESRSIDRDLLGEQAGKQFSVEVEQAINEGDLERIEELLDISYDLESWAPVDLSDAREELDSSID